ncbi:MAG: hypothetical protein M3N41_05910, partial [Acidobacteriota bacterium]|nr:hypothetical protein [Acidobacteriota bacterium]
YAFAVVALLAGLTVPASAQTTFQTCIGGAVNPTIRAEGYTELAGDITITCSGGVVTPSGSTVPAVTINVSMNTIITSKLTSTGFTPNFNEALLLIDEPGLNAAGNPLLNCGAAAAPFDPIAGVGVCSITSNGAATYSGAAGHPNVFQGRQVVGSNNQIIQFIGVPLDGGTHTLRITNIRGNAVFLSGGRITNSNFGVGLTFQTFVTFTSPNSVNAQLINVTNGSIRNGLDSVSGSPAGPYLQCIFTTVQSVSGGSVTLLEGFPSAFKARNWRQIADNGLYVGTADWQYQGTSNFSANDYVQNVPNAFYNTESGFMYPPTGIVPIPNPPPGISSATGAPAGNTPFTSGAGDPTGISTAGAVSNGTRFAVVFSGIPAGTVISVPQKVDLINVSGGSGTHTGTMLAVGGTDSDGSGSGGTVGTGGITTSGSNFTVFYEVLFADPLAIESATIPVTAVVQPFNGTNPQVNQVATAQAGFAPFYNNGAGSAAGLPLTLGRPLTSSVGPIPRFVTGLLPTTPITLYSFSRCACDLLFPWVVGDSTFTTSIVVANTSLDPGPTFGFLAAPQAGTVQFWFFGTSDISFNPSNFGTATGPATVIASQTTTASVPAGSYVAFVISPTNAGATTQTAGNGLKPIAGNFAGYVIAQSQFQYCHGIASISAPNLSPQTYLGLVLDKVSIFTGTLTGTGGGGSGTLTFTSGQQLPRTNQVFADQLEN